MNKKGMDTMPPFTAKEATAFFRTYMKCDEKLVQEWLEDKHTIHIGSPIVTEDNLYQFNDWCRLKGTAYEEGIDDQTKIARLLKEIDGLKREITTLEKEKVKLEEQLGIMPF